MAKSFDIPLKNDLNLLFNKAQQVARENGAQFKGDRRSGKFSVNGIEGKYTIFSENITVTITKKPFLVPWALVESNVMKFFS